MMHKCTMVKEGEKKKRKLCKIGNFAEIGECKTFAEIGGIYKFL